MLEGMISRLKQQRDELRVQIHLAEMEARDEYQRLSEKVDQLGEQYEPLREALEETGANVYSALGMLADELKIGFDRVRKAVVDK